MRKCSADRQWFYKAIAHGILNRYKGNVPIEAMRFEKRHDEDGREYTAFVADMQGTGLSIVVDLDDLYEHFCSEKDFPLAGSDQEGSLYKVEGKSMLPS